MAGKTMIHDKSTGKTYVGSFTPTATSTAHQQLASAAGVSTRNAVGGGLRKDTGGKWQLNQKSESINSQNGYKTYGAKSCGVAHGNRFVSAKSNLKSASRGAQEQAAVATRDWRFWVAIIAALSLLPVLLRG